MRILTFGSCFSRYVAQSYIDMFGGKLISCSYHNRIDRFTSLYINKKEVEIPLDYINSLGISDENLKYVNNQYKDHGLGKHLLPGGELFFESLSQGVDLIICDNFMDICAKLQTSKEYGLKLFLNHRNDEAVQKHFKIEDNFLDLHEALDGWRVFGDFLSESAPNAKIFFLNFPYNHSQNKDVSSRSVFFSDNFKSSNNLDVIPNIEVPKKYMLDHTPSHFDNDYYAMCAGLINFRIKGLHLTTSKK